MNHTPEKRFIAGAICPQCHLMDKTVVYDQGAGLTSECIRCGFTQKASESKKNTIGSKEKKRKVIWLGKKEDETSS